HDVVSLGPVDLDRIAGKMADAVGQARVPHISLSRVQGLREIEDCRLKAGVGGAQGDAVGAAAAAHIQKLMAALEFEPLRKHPGWPERACVLRSAEPFASDARIVDQAFVKPLVGEYSFAAERRAQMTEALVAELSIHEAHVVAEIAGGAGDEIARRRR